MVVNGGVPGKTVSGNGNRENPVACGHKFHSNTRIFTPNSPEWSNIQAECVAVAKIDAAEAKAGKDAR